ncbi:hypothetical protein [Empedobacter brevis]|uniref:hypothetical protein n=1 Tax=Empedobacter brevis TaxID=247 RepID=UPI00131FA063|nr:hypothetical protein [Empedobacter brevis]QHC86307.1 hypothetical protein AS589_16670 [Empedobacter brevis]
MVNNLENNLKILELYWKNQNILTKPCENKIIHYYKNIFPIDFIYLYSNINGMYSVYPNGSDLEGFLFYPLEYIEKISNNIYIFADYLHVSWNYGIKIDSIKNNKYSIILITDLDNINDSLIITNSLSDFIELYINDSPRIYIPC